MEYKNSVRELYGSERNTTNNRMELMSCIKALEHINRKDEPVEIIMDSRYVIAAFNEGWIEGWLRRGWKKADKKPVENKDLWLRLIGLTKQYKSIQFIKCKGHSNNEGNNRADALANYAMDNIEQQIDDE